MIKEINKELDEIANLDHTNNKDTLSIIQIALKVLGLLLTLRMKFPFKKAGNKEKWRRWLELINNGEIISQIIIKP